VIELAGRIEHSGIDILEHALAFHPGHAVSHGGFAGVSDIALVFHAQPFGVAQP